MVYDYSTNTMYALTYPGGGLSVIHTVDLTTGNLTLFAELEATLVGIACNSKGTLYVADAYGNIVAINGGGADLLCSTDFFALPGQQSLACDPSSGRLFWALKDDFSVRLLEIDTEEAGKWLDRGPIGGGNVPIVGLHVPYTQTDIVQPQSDDQSIAVYPNPSDGRVFISSVPEKSILRISDLSGRTIESYTNVSGKVELNLNLRPGIYLIQVENKGGKTVRKLIIR
jgi:hypothetical protein